MTTNVQTSPVRVVSDLEDRRRRIEECKARHPSNWNRNTK